MWRFFRDFIIYGMASVISKIAAVLLMPVYTNILTREEYGAMAMLVSVKGIIDLVSNLNIHSGIARDYYENSINRKILVSTGFWSILTLSVGIMSIMILTRNFWRMTVLGLNEDYGLSFLLLLLTIPAGSIVSYFSILTRFKKKPILFSIGTITSLIIQLTIAIYTIVILRIGIAGFFLATLISEIYSIIYFGFVNKEYISFNFNWKYLKRALIFSVPLLPAILAGWMDSSLGQILVGKYISLTDLGIYSVALQLASVFTLIGTALNNVWSPFLYEHYSESGFQTEVKRLFLTFICVLCLVSCTFSLLSKEIITLLSNPNYTDAAVYFTMLCLPMSVYLLFPMASSGISLSRDTKYTGISYVVGSILNIILLLITLPVLGVLTLPISLATSRIITYLLMSYITKKKGYLALPNKFLSLLIITVLICFCLVYMHVELTQRILCMLVINAAILCIMNSKLQLVKLIKNLRLKYLKSNKN